MLPARAVWHECGGGLGRVVASPATGDVMSVGRFIVTMADGQVFRSKPDASVNYEIENAVGRRVPVIVTLDGRGRIETLVYS